MATWGDVIGLGNLALSAYGTYSSAQQADQSRQLLAQNMAKNSAITQAALSRDWALQNRVLTRTGDMTAAIQQAMAAMGGGSFINANAIETEAQRRLSVYNDNATRAAELAISTDQANRIRTGMDVSTYDIMKDREMADATTDLFNKAYTSAYQDAVAYLSGSNDAIMKSRAQVLGELTTPYESSLKYETAMVGQGAGLASRTIPYEGSYLSSMAKADIEQTANSAQNFGMLVQKYLNDTKADKKSWLNRDWTEI